jgi:hypothetical protein
MCRKQNPTDRRKPRKGERRDVKGTVIELIKVLTPLLAALLGAWGGCGLT